MNNGDDCTLCAPRHSQFLCDIRRELYISAENLDESIEEFPSESGMSRVKELVENSYVRLRKALAMLEDERTRLWEVSEVADHFVDRLNYAVEQFKQEGKAVVDLVLIDQVKDAERAFTDLGAVVKVVDSDESEWFSFKKVIATKPSNS